MMNTHFKTYAYFLVPNMYTNNIYQLHLLIYINIYIEICIYIFFEISGPVKCQNWPIGPKRSYTREKKTEMTPLNLLIRFLGNDPLIPTYSTV